MYMWKDSPILSVQENLKHVNICGLSRQQKNDIVDIYACSIYPNFNIHTFGNFQAHLLMTATLTGARKYIIDRFLKAETE